MLILHFYLKSFKHFPGLMFNPYTSTPTPCASLTRKDSQSNSFSIIAVGGNGMSILKSVEILDEGSNEWRFGPELPLGVSTAQLVQDQRGGVILVGGAKLGSAAPLDSIFQLPHGGSDGRWVLMDQKLKVGRSVHSAFLVPDDIVDCH